MMAAISASEAGKKVIILEKNEKLGKKLFITGKGRCNVTTACPPEEFLNHVMTNPRFLYSSFSRFNNEDMIAFLNTAGLKTKVERGQRVFPFSDHSSDVIQTLKRQCEKNRVIIRYHARVTDILLNDEQTAFSGVRLEDGEIITGESLIMACGGNSYASTGSNGEGYLLAESIGHTIKPVYP